MDTLLDETLYELDGLDLATADARLDATVRRVARCLGMTVSEADVKVTVALAYEQLAAAEGS